MKQPFHLKTRKIVKLVIKFDKLPISYHNSTRKTWIRSSHFKSLDKILHFFFYIVLAVNRLSNIGIFTPNFSFLMKERRLKVTKIAHSNCNYYVWDLLIPQRKRRAKTDFISVLNPRLGQIIYAVAYSEKVTKIRKNLPTFLITK